MSITSTHEPTSLLLSKIESLKARTELLTGLNKIVSSKDNPNISDAQWYAINNQLNVVANKISRQLTYYSDKFLMDAQRGKAQYKLINALGEVELELSQAYFFYL